MKKFVFATVAVLALAGPAMAFVIPASASYSAPILTECTGTSPPHKDGHYSLIADATDGTLCVFGRKSGK